MGNDVNDVTTIRKAIHHLRKFGHTK